MADACRERWREEKGTVGDGAVEAVECAVAGRDHGGSGFAEPQQFLRVLEA